jgi:hypothetical protein
MILYLQCLHLIEVIFATNRLACITLQVTNCSVYLQEPGRLEHITVAQSYTIHFVTIY